MGEQNKPIDAALVMETLIESYGLEYFLTILAEAFDIMADRKDSMEEREIGAAMRRVSRTLNFIKWEVESL